MEKMCHLGWNGSYMYHTQTVIFIFMYIRVIIFTHSASLYRVYNLFFAVHYVFAENKFFFS